MVTSSGLTAGDVTFFYLGSSEIFVGRLVESISIIRHIVPDRHVKEAWQQAPYGQEVRLEGRLFGRNGTCPASCSGIPFVFQSADRGEHGFDDVLRSSGVWHKQDFSNLAKEKLD